ncbi:MAG TPA: DEAD/DEAH box helicase [Pirellulales bacterium]
MAINPIVYTEKIVRSFLKYQLAAYPFSDPRLHAQMRDLLSLDKVRRTPLLRGPYISLSRGFREGATIGDLIEQGVLHPHIRHIVPPDIARVYGHQERAIRAIRDRQTTLVSTGTGSGKTECFLYPIISKCLELKDADAPPGICAVIVYPMNALAEDQLDRLRSLLAGSGISFGMYVGKTPEHERDVTGRRLAAGQSKADYEAVLKTYRDAGRPDAVHPAEEVCSRERMRTPGGRPRLLLTNVKQLELLLTRQVDVELFGDARLDFLVFDEAHTFTGAGGAETACLIRRLRRFCGKDVDQTTCVATSATIVDQQDPDAARSFAGRFFGVPAESVATVHEEYHEDAWSPNFTPPPPAGEPRTLLDQALAAVDAENADAAVRDAYQRLTGRPLAAGQWKEALFDALRANELAAQIRLSLDRPRELYLLMGELEKAVGRKVAEEELLAYLTLGAASLKGGRPLLRPVVHGFLRGISGAVVTFPADNEPKLWLSGEEELQRGPDPDRAWRPKVFTCTTCGQHYYASHLKDYHFTKQKPEGGQLADGGGAYWEALDKNNGGDRVVLVDRILSQDDESDLDEAQRTATLYFCRSCGAAAPEEFGRCFACGGVSSPVKLYAIRETAKQPGNLSSCLSCGARGKRLGRRFREPIREVRAVNVSDVHVLAQDMVQHAERKRLLVFADNRQDAAFQAGWMKDHARRFRLRSLMAEAMRGAAVSIGDMTARISQQLEASDVLSRSLIPEVWRAVPKEGTGGMHEDERLHFLRIQVLREVTMAANQQIGLEPWGRMKVTYRGLEASAPFVQSWSNKLKLPADELLGGIAALVDHLRRRRLLYDSRRAIFSRFWHEGDREIQRGYLPVMPGPKGMKLRAASDDDKARVSQWIGARATLVQQIAKKWGVAADDVPGFLEELWRYLTQGELPLLAPVTLKGSKDRALPNCSGVYQIDSSKLLLSENHGHYRCQRCRRKVMRRTPGNRCLAWQCDGELEFVGEDPDNYNLQLLDERYEMLRPEEHTAMVPQEQRERIENLFKGSGDAVNALVCTQTLELGVDIGALDAVLLRNVPPLPANYWQRAGRAGRRHRMAVNLTYCRPTSHDRAYFNEPPKMLAGRVDPPAFNLRNDLMVAKHAHAAIITRLNQLARDASLSPAERDETKAVLAAVFPGRISSYLFETTGQLRAAPFDLAPLASLIARHRADLKRYVEGIFQQGWPAADGDVTKEQALEGHIDLMAEVLGGLLARLRRRLLWAVREVQRLNKVREGQATLDAEDEAHFRRCDRLIKKLKGVQPKRRREAEGVDDISTFGVLAAEGFLPGYGLDTGSVVAMAEVPYWHLGSMDFDLPRPPSVALREYVPGNLIYANGHRFVARRFHRDLEGEQGETPLFEVNVEREAICETSAGQNAGSLTSGTLPAIGVCDVDLLHQSQISDEEETRFQMSVATYGREHGRHNGGQMYGWGERQLSLRRGVHLRLVNVGASSLVEQDTPELGYPVCAICGQSVSPLASEAQLDHFREDHERRCGRRPAALGFFADIVADCLSLPACANASVAYSVLESLRMAAAQFIDMHLEDLQILVIGHVDRDEVDGVLWDPMPGGSGLLEQLRANFKRIVQVAREIAAGCPSACDTSCIDCLQTFRNGFYHKYLDRHAALEAFNAWGDELKPEHAIPATQTAPQTGDSAAQPVNDGETRLKHLLAAAGFTSGSFQNQIRFKQPLLLDPLIGGTTPDVYFVGDADDADDKGVCIYLDGMSAALHGDPAMAARDREIRGWLRNNGYQVIEITRVELDDRHAMIRHFRKLARHLQGKDLADRIQADASWFD